MKDKGRLYSEQQFANTAGIIWQLDRTAIVHQWRPTCFYVDISLAGENEEEFLKESWLSAKSRFPEAIPV